MEENTLNEKINSIIERIDKGNSQKSEYTWELNLDDALNKADDSSLEIAIDLLERGKFTLSFEDNNLSVLCFIDSFCDETDTNQGYLNKLKDNPDLKKTSKEKSWSFNVNKYLGFDACTTCKYQACPKVLAAYILYLKNTNKLREKLIARAEYRAQHHSDPYFMFEWNTDEGLKKVDQKTFEFAYRLVKEDYIRLLRNLIDGKIRIQSKVRCYEFCKMEEDFSVFKSRDWAHYTWYSRATNCNPTGSCSDLSCNFSSCIAKVAGYIYYLEKSGNSNKILEDRTYYLEHKDEIEKKNYEFLESTKDERSIQAGIDELDYGNSDKTKYDFPFEMDNLLNHADDNSLKVAYDIVKRGKLKLEEKDGEIKVYNYLCSLCNYKENDEDYLNKIAKEPEYYIDSQSGCFSFNVKDVFDYGKEKTCNNCKYQSCPKVLAAYILYLKNNETLKEKLLARKKIRAENKLNPYFTFEWKLPDGLKKVNEDVFNYANNLVDKNYIRVIRALTSNNNILFRYKFDCTALNQYQIKNNIIPEGSRYLTRELDVDLASYCSEAGCKLNYCTVVIAGYIYYLKKSGYEEVIKEDRKYYQEHKDEIENENQKLAEQKEIEEKNKKQQSIENIKQSYDGKVDNLDFTLNSILESDKTSFHCLVVGEDEEEKNNFIDKIIEVVQKRNSTVSEVRRLPLNTFWGLYWYKTDVFVNKNNKLIYSDISSKEEQNSAGKRDKDGIFYSMSKQMRSPKIESNVIYVLEDIKAFIKKYKSYKSANYEDDNYKDQIISKLTNIVSKNYIIIKANKEEIEGFIDLDPRLSFVYKNSTILLPNYSIDYVYEHFKINLNNQLLDEIQKNEEEYKNKFVEYVSLNKKFLPLNISEIDDYLAEYMNVRNSIELPPDVYKKENLDNIVGLDSVKTKLKEFEKYMMFQVKAKANGLELDSSNMHMIFTGNPGTGKTTVARIIARMLFNLGIIKENKLVEVERKDLVAEYIGQTAIKTSEVINKAMGGVLFIDEAYSLNAHSERDFGKEAITTLIKAMEDDKDKFIVIFAGYRNEMQSFLNLNPGIASRIGYRFDFPNYGIDELTEIFKTKVKKSGFEFEDSIFQKLEKVFKYYSKMDNFGNGRFVDKVVQETLMKHAINNSNNIKLISIDDIPSIEELNQSSSNKNKEQAKTTDEMMQDLIGMENIKIEIKQFASYASFLKKAEKNHLNVPEFNMHMIFTGNPGTGKTTIARIIAKMLFDMEIIHEDKLIEVERKDLIAEYIGQTAIKTAEVIERAMGGVLFIDEAYTLAQGSKNDYGSEAIATLIKAMEDHKGSLVVIFAGYRNEMKEFIDSNPGIASRIGYTFNFDDYSVPELLQIFYRKIENSGFKVEEKADVLLKRDCEYFSKMKNFGNGRFVDKLIQKTLLKHAKNIDESNIELITENDIPTIEELNQNFIKNSDNVEAMLKNIVGMDELKEEILSFGNYVNFVKEAEKHNLKIPASNMHMVFTGNPGTGKTTIARIIAKMLFDMEVIHENKLIEVERKDLIAGYIGQTATKTNEVIERAMGGVLFIDEAYTLSSGYQNDFGGEAIATIIKAMEDHKGEFIIIFAGYKDEMKNFIDMNPGIASRIGYVFNFKDYSDTELTEIFKRKVEQANMKLEDGVLDEIKKIMKYFYKVENIGNGRFVDKVFSKALVNHAKNIQQKLISLDEISIIKIIDIPSINDITATLLNGDNMINLDNITPQSMKKTAIHEIGHATVGYLLTKESGIKKITCSAEGMGALGYVEYDNSKNSYTHTKEGLFNVIKKCLAGIAAEKVFLGTYESGGTSDLETATNIARRIITDYGMSDLGLAHVSSNNTELEKVIYDEENKILNECFEEVQKLIVENKDKMEKVVDYLMEKGEINAEEFEAAFNS